MGSRANTPRTIRLARSLEPQVPYKTVIYLRGDLEQAVAEVGELCRSEGVSGWSLRGNPFMLHYPPQTSAAHICLLKQQILDRHDVHLDSAIGTLHLFQVAEDKVRIAARSELLDGQPLASPSDQLAIFCRQLQKHLASEGLAASSRELGVELKPTVRLSTPDTGPLIS